MINVDTSGTNITNEGGALVPFVWQGTAAAPSNNNAATRLDWLSTGGTYNPGLIQQYNTLTGASLPQPGVQVIDDGTASGNGAGYALGAGYQYYVTAHFGGYFAAWVVDAANAGDTYQVPTAIGGVTGADAYGAQQVLDQRLDDKGKVVKYTGGGLSNVRIWQGGKTNVPDSGSSLVLLGLGLGLLGFIKRRK